MSTLNVSNITDGTDTVGTSYVLNGSAKAWVNFNGTGVVAIRDSQNGSSITDLAAGEYTFNFTSNMDNSNYGTNVTSASNSGYNRDGVQIACIASNLTVPMTNASDVSMMTSGAANGNGSDTGAQCCNITVHGDLA